MKQNPQRSVKAWACGPLRWRGCSQLNIYMERKTAERCARYSDPPDEVFQVEIREVKRAK